MLTQKLQKVANKYICEYCDYSTSRKSSYDKHILSAKHINLTSFNINATKVAKVAKEQNTDDISSYSCEHCLKKYKTRVGLWYHKKKCSPILENTMVLAKPQIDNDLVLNLIKQNGELQKQNVEVQKQNGELQKQNSEILKQLVEIVKEPKTYNNNGTINNRFNLQIFLNETCKDALNINEFIENIKVTFEDILNLSKKGYVTGITDVIKTEWNALDITKRPFHCTDVKRETIYIKDNDEWNKDSEDLPKIKKAIKNVAQKCRIKTSEWCQNNPDIRVLDSEANRIQLNLCEALYADTDEDKSITKSVQEIAKLTQLKRS
uniref:C2H2-type domain-containing protein n=1 Tax=viral metagenome TaxID=1070528 RepID=A0A6C0ASW2_9ZZZZ